MAKAPPAARSAKSSHRESKRNGGDPRKEMVNLERTIARLDGQKRELNARFTSTTDPAEAMQLHTEVTTLTNEIAAAEERWCELQEELGDG
jgi:ATP-binding cassette subfamily F protein 3